MKPPSKSPLKLWSIHNADYFDNAINQKPNHGLTADWAFVDPDFLRAYRWMSQQMTKRINAKTNTCPLWAWYRYDGQNKCPNNLTAQDAWHLPAKTKGVCVEIQLPENQVLLSQFAPWHCVLNQHPFDLTEEKNEPQANIPKGHVSKATASTKQTLKRHRAQTHTPQTHIPNPQTSHQAQTWEHIFDLKAGDTNLWGQYHERWIQACITHIPFDAITDTIYFTVN